MRANEFLVEWGDKPDEYTEVDKTGNSQIFKVDGLDLRVEFFATKEPKNVISTSIGFDVKDMYHLTGKGNAVKILSTVSKIIKDNLSDFVTRTNSNIIECSADSKEPSRVKLYDRIEPLISKYLGSTWHFTTDADSFMKMYKWTKSKSLEESFDTKVPYTELKDTPYEYSTQANIDDHDVEFLATQDSDGDPWHIAFTVDDSLIQQDIGSKTSMKIFAFVVQCSKYVIDRRRPELLSFSAAANERTKIKLYARFAEMLKSEYKLSVQHDRDYVHFNFKRK